ncbi:MULTISPECIES: DNA alkylation repair protein [unclassified Myroides]|uniref:DNA alkylation repair protein n=1 Tax=unclassified Myroides TaxID=2642485 RepID=UPI00310132BB
MEKRKGARSMKDIPTAILEQLNRGEIESANLTEWLAIDKLLLVENVLADLKRTAYIPIVLDGIAGLKKVTANTINQSVGHTLYQLSKERGDKELFGLLKNHKSDSVRCWATYFIQYNKEMLISGKLKAISDFARDTHFGVREISWMAVRQDIIENLEESLNLLQEWTKDGNENIRRFASEATRPRGVWATHITELKVNPSLALPILEVLKADSSKYVRDSVGNWLNDAAKDNPLFVKEVCDEWMRENGSKETAYIIKKGTRNP